MIKIFSLITLTFLFTISGVQAAKNVYLDLEGQTQGDNNSTNSDSSLELRAIQPDPIGDSDNESVDAILEQKNSDTESSDKDHKGEIDVLSIDKSSDKELEMNKSDLIEDVLPLPEPRGTEIEDIGITSGDNDEEDEQSENDNGAAPGTQVSPSQIKVLILSPLVDDETKKHDPGVTILESLFPGE